VLWLTAGTKDVIGLEDSIWVATCYSWDNCETVRLEQPPRYWSYEI
jgi:hypothetical protein